LTDIKFYNEFLSDFILVKKIFFYKLVINVIFNFGVFWENCSGGKGVDFGKKVASSWGVR